MDKSATGEKDINYLISRCMPRKIVLLVSMCVFDVNFRLLDFFSIRLWVAISYR